MEVLPDFGKSLHEGEVKTALQALNPNIHFDMGGNLNLHHPKIDQWQGVFYNGEHISSLQRGTIPEFNVYRAKQTKDKDGNKVQVRGEVMFIGWRTTFENLARQRIPGVTWDALCIAFSIDRKKFTGDPKELEVA